MELATWISTISIAAGAMVGIANLTVMGLLTRTIHRHSVRAAEQDVLRRNSDQWQRLNMAFIQSPGLQRILDGHEFVSAEENEIHLNLLFYILNTVFEIYQARESGLVSAGTANRLMLGQTAILKPHAAEVERVLSLRRGYDAGFCDFIRGVIGPV
jgi:hypothetical protein